jgi:hypothetical protein
VGTGSPAIFVYDLDDDAFPINKRMIGISRSGVPDGIHIDDADQTWTGEFEGVVGEECNGQSSWTIQFGGDCCESGCASPKLRTGRGHSGTA